jgi:hypothetical protein
VKGAATLWGLSNSTPAVHDLPQSVPSLLPVDGGVLLVGGVGTGHVSHGSLAALHLHPGDAIIVRVLLQTLPSVRAAQLRQEIEALLMRGQQEILLLCCVGSKQAGDHLKGVALQC